MPFISLTDLNDPRLDPYRNLKLTNQTRTTGHLIAEGHRVVRRLVDSDFAVESIVVSERRKHTIDDIDSDRYQIFVIPEEVGTQLVGFEFHAGVLAAGKRREPPSISEWLPRNATASELVVVCPRITDPDNLGTLMRLCVGFGVRALLLGPGSTDPYSRRVLRVSMGHAFFLPIIQTDDLSPHLIALRERHGFRFLATVLDETATPLDQFPFGGASDRAPTPMGLFLGNEADGLDPEWVDFCHDRVTIPMGPQADSLNVSVAAGIFLHWFRGRSGV
ncbi:MAG: RNA methyltransferase [Planctomycetota bacterium]|nr:MAG: RNA methyltransferase [Planctomycetota bacterium]